MKIGVVGGGIAGLTAAYNISCNPRANVILFEASDRFGGWIRTKTRLNNSKYEEGPRTIRISGVNGERCVHLLDEIAIGRQVMPIKSKHPAALNRFIALDGKLVTLPYNYRSFFKHPKFYSWLKAGIKEHYFKPPRVNPSLDETVYNFFYRRFGREIAELISDPLCRGISASDCRTLSLGSMFPQLALHEMNFGSVLKGVRKSLPVRYFEEESKLCQRSRLEKWSMLSFKDGMQQLPAALLNILRDRENVEVYTNSRIDSIGVKEPNVGVELNGRTVYCDHVISAVPTFTLAKLLRHTELQEELAAIEYVDVALVSLEFKDVNINIDGFGCLIPSSENPAVLGITFDSCIFPEFNTDQYKSCRLSVMLGGDWFQEHFGDINTCDERVIIEKSLDAIKLYLGISSAPSNMEVSLLAKCIPHYTVGHTGRAENFNKIIQDEQLNLTLVGAGYFGAGIPDCIVNAIDATEPLHSKINDMFFSMW